ncbi:MAG TPA: HlyD family efflux transporter periplasmic adaptor subunit, partial [Gemmatimonadaceae bacterium]|nr:HlyD family efflux transporter periplasmic adaptor subunit [Gemmatimonadaceae bacterium]
VRVRTLVNETDIGKIRAGLSATVTVDAFPDRPFVGTVEKIEPQATIQQSVTMFPVLVSIDNVSGLLMPGMNGEVSIETQRRENALAVSNDAVRSPNEASQVATLLGLSPDSVRAQLASQRGSFGGQRAQGANGQANGGQAADPQSGSAQNTAQQPQGGAQNGGQGRQGGFNLPEVTDQQCQKVTATLAKHPDVQTKIGDLRTKMMNGEIDRQAMQAEMQKIYSAAGVDAQVARACSFRERQKSQGGQNAQGAARQGAGQAGAAQAGAAQTGAFQGAGASRARRGMVFVVKNGKYTPKVVRLGVSNYDVSEVLSGLNEGDSVAILNVAAMQAKQQADLDQIRNRAGVPGLQRQQGTQGGAAGGAQGGAAGRPGAGAPRGGGGG